MTSLKESLNNALYEYVNHYKYTPSIDDIEGINPKILKTPEFKSFISYTYLMKNVVEYFKEWKNIKNFDTLCKKTESGLDNFTTVIPLFIMAKICFYSTDFIKECGIDENPNNKLYKSVCDNLYRFFNDCWQSDYDRKGDVGTDIDYNDKRQDLYIEKLWDFKNRCRDIEKIWFKDKNTFGDILVHNNIEKLNNNFKEIVYDMQRIKKIEEEIWYPYF